MLAVVVWVALVVWLALVIWSLSVVRAAAGADAPAAAPPEPIRESRPRLPLAGRRRWVAIAQAVAAGRLLRSPRSCSPTPSSGAPLPLVGLLALLVLGSDILVLDAKRFRIGGSFTGLVLAMALLGPAPAAVLGLGVRAGRRRSPARARHLPAQQPPHLHDVPAARRRRPAHARQLAPGGGRLRDRRVRRVHRRQRAELPDDRRAHAAAARRLAGPDVPHGLHPGAAVGGRLGGDDRDGRLRLRGLRRRDHRAVRARARRLPAAAARAARGPGALGGDRAPDRPARRPPRGDARPAAGDARAARPERRPPRRRRRPLRARAGPRGRAVRARAGGRPHRRRSCTTSARRRCPTTS